MVRSPFPGWSAIQPLAQPSPLRGERERVRGAGAQTERRGGAGPVGGLLGGKDPTGRLSSTHDPSRADPPSIWRAGKNRKHLTSLVPIVVVGFIRRTQIVAEDVLADVPSLVGPRLLVEAEVDAAVDAGVTDVVGDLLPGGVVEDDARQPGIGQRDGMAALAEGPLKHRAGGAR